MYSETPFENKFIVSIDVTNDSSVSLDVLLAYFIYFLLFFSDIDECESPGTCSNGRCTNFAGGYECSCDPGFETSSDMRRCVGKL